MMAIFSPTFISVETWPSMRVMSWWFGVKAILLVDVRGAVDPGDGLARWGGGLYDAGTAFAGIGGELLRARPAPTISCASFSATGRGRGREATHLVRQPPPYPTADMFAWKKSSTMDFSGDSGATLGRRCARRRRKAWQNSRKIGRSDFQSSSRVCAIRRSRSVTTPIFLCATVQLVYNDSLYQIYDIIIMHNTLRQ